MGSCTHIVDDRKILNQYEYDAWGNVTSQKETVKNRFKFNGQQLDPITQQYYLRARFYNPVIGRFTQEDTYRGDGLNLYSYCANNPVYYVDPSGNACEPQKDIYNDILHKQRVGSALKIDNVEAVRDGKNNIIKEFPSVAQAHGFTDLLDNYVGYATKTSINNGMLYQLEGSLNGVNGRFEWIIQDGKVTHRMFVTNGTMNGVPIIP